MLKELWKERQQLVEEQLVRELEQEPPLDARLAEVAEHYALFGGRSPLNERNADLARERVGMFLTVVAAGEVAA